MQKVLVQIAAEMYDCEQCPKCKTWFATEKGHECKQKLIKHKKEKETVAA